MDAIGHRAYREKPCSPYIFPSTYMRRFHLSATCVRLDVGSCQISLIRGREFRIWWWILGGDGLIFCTWINACSTGPPLATAVGEYSLIHWTKQHKFVIFLHPTPRSTHSTSWNCYSVRNIVKNAFSEKRSSMNDVIDVIVIRGILRFFSDVTNAFFMTMFSAANSRTSRLFWK